MLFISDNVLEADVIRSMYRVRKEIENIQTEFGELKTMRQDGRDRPQTTSALLRGEGVSGMLTSAHDEYMRSHNFDNFHLSSQIFF